MSYRCHLNSVEILMPCTPVCTEINHIWRFVTHRFREAPPRCLRRFTCCPWLTIWIRWCSWCCERASRAIICRGMWPKLLRSARKWKMLIICGCHVAWKRIRLSLKEKMERITCKLSKLNCTRCHKAKGIQCVYQMKNQKFWTKISLLYWWILKSVSI